MVRYVFLVLLCGVFFSCNYNRQQYHVFGGLTRDSLNNRNVCFYRCLEKESYSYNEVIFEPFVLEKKDFIYLEGYWGSVNDTLYLILDPFFNKDCIIRYPILCISDTINAIAKKMSYTSNCGEVFDPTSPPEPYSYKVESYENGIYSVSFSNVGQLSANDISILTIDISLQFGVLNIKYIEGKYDFLVPWLWSSDIR